MKTISVCIILLVIVLASCSKKFYNGGVSSYGGQIQRIDYMTVDGVKSMFLHTDKYIVLTEYNSKIQLDDSVFIYETLPVNFYDPFEWVVINGRKTPIK